MLDERRKVKISKYLSKHLRHEPERLGLELAPGGWVPVTELLEACARSQFPIRLEDLKEVVRTNDKQRFSFDETGTLIRANQGHSVEVDLQLEPTMPPEVLFHGTGKGSVEAILRSGLKKMSRHHVHLSTDQETAQKVGARHGLPVVLSVDAAAMHRAGFEFYCSDNGVWLIDEVPPAYIYQSQLANLNQYDYFLVVDLEATCCDDKSIKSNQTEIIEIGAVMVEAKSLSAIAQFQTFIKPVRFPILTDFCQSLTSITQADVDQAPTYSDAIARFQSWLAAYPNFLFCSWGDYDRRQFKQDSKFHKIENPLEGDHLNLKKQFSGTQMLPSTYGMVGALNLANIELEGTHHRGIDDARNIAKLLPYCIGRQYLKESKE
jgi:putative RNA 2'-phosphotransferase